MFGRERGGEGLSTDAETEEAEEGDGMGGQAPAEFAGAGLLVLREVHGGQRVCLGGQIPMSRYVAVSEIGGRRAEALGAARG